MRVTIPISETVSLGIRDLEALLRFKGLDTSKHFAMRDEGVNRIYVGDPLPEKHSGYMKTCVGLVPIKKPWLEAVA